MSVSSWLRHWKRSAPAPHRRTPTSLRSGGSFRPRLEALEDRCLPSGLPYPIVATVSQLIADINYADTTGGAFTINLTPHSTFDLKSVNNTTDGPNGLPVIGGTKPVDLTILGNGDTIERVSVTTKTHHGSTDYFRLFDVAPGASLTVDHVTLQGGSGSGGAIYNRGTLKVINGSILSGNSGGGISNNTGGTVAVSNSTLSNNSGSGISNTGGMVTVSYSTLSGNYALEGGGIFNDGTVLVENNSSITGNAVEYGTFGPDVYNGGVLYLDSTSTIGGLDGNPAIPI
jgi:hypothetical protein